MDAHPPEMLVNITIQHQLPAPKKSQVDNGGEGIDKLQDEGFEDETIVKTLVGLWNL